MLANTATNKYNLLVKCFQVMSEMYHLEYLNSCLYDISGYFFKLIGTRMALKFLKKKTTKLKSFLREYSISLYLSPCPFIINMFGIAFETEEYYVFVQEYAPSGDLFDIIPPQVLILRHKAHSLLFLSFQNLVCQNFHHCTF